MDEVIKLVKTCGATAALTDRLRLGEDLFRLIEADVRLYVFHVISPRRRGYFAGNPNGQRHQHGQI
jgi:hypothetical protein